MGNLSKTTSGMALVDPAVVAAAIERGRRERSKAFWTMLRAMFRYPKHRAAKKITVTREPNIYGAR